MVDINLKEEVILTVLLKSRLSLTTSAIAKKSEISWNTADKYLREMEENGWVENKMGFWRPIVSRKDFPEYYD